MIGRHRRERDANRVTQHDEPSLLDPVPPIARTPAMQSDLDVARLTAKADLIMTELDTVVRQMADMLREAVQT